MLQMIVASAPTRRRLLPSPILFGQLPYDTSYATLSCRDDGFQRGLVSRSLARSGFHHLCYPISCMRHHHSLTNVLSRSLAPGLTRSCGVSGPLVCYHMRFLCCAFFARSSDSRFSRRPPRFLSRSVCPSWFSLLAPLFRFFVAST